MVQGSIDLAWAVKAKAWELRLGAAMLRPYFPVVAAMLDRRADLQDPERRQWLPVTAEPTQVM